MLFTQMFTHYVWKLQWLDMSGSFYQPRKQNSQIKEKNWDYYHEVIKIQLFIIFCIIKFDAITSLKSKVEYSRMFSQSSITRFSRSKWNLGFFWPNIYFESTLFKVKITNNSYLIIKTDLKDSSLFADRSYYLNLTATFTCYLLM